jgi:hypothetical protein
MTADKELESMWKEAVGSCFEVLSQDLPGGTERNDEVPLSG